MEICARHKGYRLVARHRRRQFRASHRCPGASGFHPKRSPPIVRLGQLYLLQLLYQPPETFLDLQIDLLLARSDYHRKALDRRVPIRLADLDIEIDVLACEDLILHKLLAERIVDLADTAALLRANRESLDYAYLLNWIENLGLWPPFRQAWHAVWPDEPIPGPSPGQG